MRWLDATRQALVNAVTHGGEPVSLYCEASDTMVEVFVRDHRRRLRYGRHSARPAGHPRIDYRPHQNGAAVQWR